MGFFKGVNNPSSFQHNHVIHCIYVLCSSCVAALLSFLCPSYSCTSGTCKLLQTCLADCSNLTCSFRKTTTKTSLLEEGWSKRNNTGIVCIWILLPLWQFRFHIWTCPKYISKGLIQIILFFFSCSVCGIHLIF